jgi:aspartokinase/homoserine dehydrogenase 1
MPTPQKHIIKFGGSSLKTPSLIDQSAEIVIERMQTARPYVVVSAVGGITDALIQLADEYANDEQIASKKVQELEEHHQQLFDELVSADHPQRDNLLDLFRELNTTVKDHSFRKQNPRIWRDRILSIGERASAIIFAAVLSNKNLPAKPYEAHNFIKTDSTYGQAKVKPDTTRQLVRKFLEDPKTVPVITGFIGSDSAEQITTLGRSGSDYSASIIADALDADHLEIWTDVNGVLTADPKWVPTAEPIEQLSFVDISELSAHGAKVIHPQTIQPIRDKETSVLVKNSYNPAHPGTLITSGYSSNGALKTITLAGPFVRLQIEEGYAYDLLPKLNEWLDKSPKSNAIGFYRPSDFEPARFVLRQSFFERISDRLAKWAADNNIVLDLQNDLYKVKKFSNHFGENETLSKRIWDLLASNNLQPINTNRNRDERFISFLFEKDDAQRAARLMNDYLQGNQTVIDLFVAGTGAVGQTLLEQLKNLEPDGIQFRLLGVCNSRNALWSDNGLSFNSGLDWSKSEDTNWTKLTEKLTQSFRHNLVFVDATGSKEVARLYPEFFSNGLHVVTPSKLANTFEQSFFDKLQSLIDEHNISFRYETTVGAGLPVISTLNDLQSGGDQISEISGVVSGTMTYLFNQLEEGVAFSKAIVDAREQGYAEPDPRDDLSGEDVARKFLTLARTLGLKIERDELEVESLIPKELQDVDQNTFFEELHRYDNQWEQRIRIAQERSETLRYTGQLKDGKISIGIQSVPKDSPLGQLKGTDNLIQIFSRLYKQAPLIIQGAGAGKEVTAAGVLSDILKTAKSLS